MSIPCAAPPPVAAAPPCAPDKARPQLPAIASEPIASAAVIGTSLRRIKSRRLTASFASAAIKRRRATHADTSTHQSQKCAFHKELEHDAAVGRAQRLAQADFARAIGDRHQHDVDDPNRAQGQRHQADAAQEHDSWRRKSCPPGRRCGSCPIRRTHPDCGNRSRDCGR